MPYITQEGRVHLSKEGTLPANPGELNYMITELIIAYAKEHNNYQGINDIVGALEGAKMEFYRRWAAPYEDYKIAVNGDVYPTGEG